MKIITSGYPLTFIQTEKVRDNSAHIQSYIFKFFSSKTRLHYIVRAEMHQYNFIAVKFYAKKDRKSSLKYSNIINRGDVANILVTSAKVVPWMLRKFPDASFGFIGARSIDLSSHKIENYKNNQRYRLYAYHIPQLFGFETFVHKKYNQASAYSLLNRKAKNFRLLESRIKEMIVETYPELLQIEFN